MNSRFRNFAMCKKDYFYRKLSMLSVMIFSLMLKDNCCFDAFFANTLYQIVLETQQALS